MKACEPGYAGDSCQYNDQDDCNCHGFAQHDGSCYCDSFWGGSSCDESSPTGVYLYEFYHRSARMVGPCEGSTLRFATRRRQRDGHVGHEWGHAELALGTEGPLLKPVELHTVLEGFLPAEDDEGRRDEESGARKMMRGRGKKKGWEEGGVLTPT